MGLISLIKGTLEGWNWDATTLTAGDTNPDGTTTAAAARLPVAASVPVTGTTAKSTAGAGAPDQALKNFSSNGGVSINTGATVALYTVTPGKTFFLTDIAIYANTAVPFLVQLKAGAAVIFEAYCKGDTGPIQVAGIETQPSAAAGSALSLVLGTAASTNATYNIDGFEQ